MVANTALNLQQSTTLGGALLGFWKLAPERAVTLHPGEDGVLRVAQGRVWATLDGPHHGPANDWGDVILHSGEQLTLAPGQHVVVESFGEAVNEPVYFSWEPVSAIAQAVPAGESGWHDVLARPSQLDGEIGITLHALGRWLARLPGTLQYLAAGKGRVLHYLESNQP